MPESPSAPAGQGDSEPASGVSQGPGAARAFLLMAAVLAVFFAPAISSRDQFLYRDAGRMHWPVKRYVAEQLRRGHLPEWNPYVGLGVPIVAGAIDAVQHPFNLLLLVFPFEVGFKLWVLLSYLVAAMGGYAWARQLDRSWHASLAAGLAFALSGFLVGSSDNLTYLTTLAALPWVFAAAHAWLGRGGAARLALLGLASGFCAAGGDPQAWGFAVVLLPGYAAVMTRGDGGRPLARGLGALAAALAGAAPFVLPVLAWLPHSSRGGEMDLLEIGRWSLPAVRLLELVLPHMFRDEPGTLRSWVYIAFGGGESPIPWVLSVYVGASVIALAALGVARARPARWLATGAAVLGWMALGPGGGLGRLFPLVPVLRGFRYWEKMAVWPSLLLVMAAAFGLDELSSEPEKGRRRFVAAAGTGAAFALAASGLLALFPERAAALLSRSPHPAGAAHLRDAASAFAGNLRDGLLEAGTVVAVLALAVAVTRRGALRQWRPALVALVVVADLLAANVRGYTLSDPIIVESRAPFGEYLRGRSGLQRVLTPFDMTPESSPHLREFEASWLWATHMLEASLNVRYRVGNAFPYAGMPPERSQRFLRRAPERRQLPHVGALGIAYVSVPSSPDLAGSIGLAPPYLVAAQDPLLPAFLVRVPHRERAYLAGELASVDRRHAMEFLLGVDPSATDRSVVEGPVPPDYRPPAGEARLVTDLPERVDVETASGGPVLLVLNDAYAAGWRATVDGRLAEILPANYLARGVWVPAGAHRVEFAYRTPGLREGWAVFLLGGLVLAVAAGRKARSGGPRP